MPPVSMFAFRVTALLGFLAVGLGALGAHGPVHDAMLRNHTGEFWEKAVFYHVIHSAVMLTACTLRPFPLAAWCLLGAGIIAFSGSLYLLSFVTAHWLVFVTPLGGLCLLAGWLLLCVWKQMASEECAPSV